MLPNTHGAKMHEAHIAKMKAIAAMVGISDTRAIAGMVAISEAKAAKAKAPAGAAIVVPWVNSIAQQAWDYVPEIQDARAKDIAHRDLLRMASSNPNSVMVALLRDPAALTIDAQAIMHHEWEIAKKASVAIPPFQGEAHRLEPPPAKSAPHPPPPSWSAAAQRARRAAKASSQGRTLRVYTRAIVQADGDSTREQLRVMETAAVERHNELMGASSKPPPAKKAKGASPAAPPPKLTATEKKAAAAERKAKAAAKASANADYWAQKAASYQ